MSNNNKIVVNKGNNEVTLSWKITQGDKDLVLNDNDNLTLSINGNEEEIKDIKSKTISVSEDTNVNLSLSRNGKVIKTDDIFIDYDETSDEPIEPPVEQKSYVYYGSIKAYDGENTEIAWNTGLKDVTIDYISNMDMGGCQEVSEIEVASAAEVLKYDNSDVEGIYQFYTADEMYDQSQIVFMYPETFGEVSVTVIKEDGSNLQSITVYDANTDKYNTGIYKTFKEIDGVNYVVLVHKQITATANKKFNITPPIRIKFVKK